MEKFVTGVLSAVLAITPLYLAYSFYRLNRVSFISPVPCVWDNQIRCDSRGDGFFQSPRYGNRLHNGVDLRGDMYSPVVACRSGRVLSARYSKGMGNFIVLAHDGNLVTIYGHLTDLYVRKGDSVLQGQKIGSIGKTGNADHPDIQPHLHFEIRKDDIPQNPAEYLP
jgi:murein DD-endopeptidase MepM/ murein hydrolase activator NlpD